MASYQRVRPFRRWIFSVLEPRNEPLSRLLKSTSVPPSIQVFPTQHWSCFLSYLLIPVSFRGAYMSTLLALRRFSVGRIHSVFSLLSAWFRIFEPRNSGSKCIFLVHSVSQMNIVYRFLLGILLPHLFFLPSVWHFIGRISFHCEPFSKFCVLYCFSNICLSGTCLPTCKLWWYFPR